MKKIFTIAALSSFIILSTQCFSHTVYSSEKGEKYHTADCRLSGNVEAVDLAKVKKAGKKGCDVCKPDEWVKAKLTQCIGKTKEGNRCKRMTGNKEKKCFQHQGA